ncbi:class I SAM-dependent methyltransferase [Nocardioides bruguierae]|uniref:class I SAM-dependent methyltransferase n=1 Tax=Nocardioides bruguierae TaxID=2945102 RepID=UPI002021F92C|nr:class I SAM-dependent methyltransferase [Nocardioides bruguierae]MCL8026007.1 methyltransferase domain-containing protein [Nocardioides bruguierae]
MPEPDQRPEAVALAYDTVAATYAALLPDTRAETPLELAVLDAFVAAVGPGARVLDAGCGTGRITRYLADRGLAVRGADLSPGMIAMAREHQPDLSFEVAPLTRLPHEDASLDGVVLWYSTIHTPRDGQERIWAEARRVLRPGGHLVAAFQAGTGTRDTAPSHRRHGHEVTLLRYRFTADEVASWCAGAGLVDTARMVRGPVGSEVDDQAVLLARVGA